MSDSKKGITKEMIETAKGYPFEKLYRFTGRTCRCPFHEDSDPSMKLYSNNTVHCFSCEKSWDTIEFIRKLEGLSFREAVKKLQRFNSSGIDRDEN